MKAERGFKVVWRAAGGKTATSLNADVLPAAGRQYEPGKPVEPAPELGPLCVFSANNRSAAEELAAHFAVTVRFDDGCAEVWECEWLPWEEALPVFTLPDGAEIEAVIWHRPLNGAKDDPKSLRLLTTRDRLPAGTRLARQVTLRRLVGRVRAVGKPRRAQWE